MKSHRTDFSTGNVYRNICEVAVPMIFAQLLNLLYNVVDRIYIGRIPGTGTTALTGVGLCFPIITLVSAFTYLYGNGGSPLCAMEYGRGDTTEAENYMGNSFTLLVGTGLFLTVLGLLIYKPVLYLFGASDITFPFAEEYIRIYLLGTVFVMVSVGMNPFINCQGFGSMGMLTILIGAVLNIILDPLFIFVFHLGVSGAAIATILSQFCSALWVFRFLTGPKAVLQLKRNTLRLKAARVRKILGLGVSGFFMAFTNSLVQVACNATLQIYGGDLYVGVMTVLNSVRDICTMPVQGFTNGASPVMSFNYGEGAYHKVRKAIGFITAACVTYTMLMWGLLKLFPAFFIRIFNDNPQLVKTGIPRPAHLFLRLLLHGAAVYRAEYLCGSGQVPLRHLFLPASKGDHRGAADHPPSPRGRTWHRRRVLGRAHLQPAGRLRLLYHHAAHGAAGASAEKLKRWAKKTHLLLCYSLKNRIVFPVILLPTDPV